MYTLLECAGSLTFCIEICEDPPWNRYMKGWVDTRASHRKQWTFVILQEKINNNDKVRVEKSRIMQWKHCREEDYSASKVSQWKNWLLKVSTLTFLDFSCFLLLQLKSKKKRKKTILWQSEIRGRSEPKPFVVNSRWYKFLTVPCQNY